MLFQLHWQNVREPSQTRFVAQDGGDNEIAYMGAIARLERVATLRRKECPLGWVPMYCNELSERFMWAVEPAEAN